VVRSPEKPQKPGGPHGLDQSPHITVRSQSSEWRNRQGRPYVYPAPSCRRRDTAGFCSLPGRRAFTEIGNFPPSTNAVFSEEGKISRETDRVTTGFRTDDDQTNQETRQPNMAMDAAGRADMSRKSRFQLVGAPLDTTTWRLLGGNNISLGSGAIHYADAAECVAAIEWLQANLAMARTEFSHASGGRWRWLLYVDRMLLATASHAYGRRIEARRGLDRFLVAAPVAPVLAANGKVADWRRKYRRTRPNEGEARASSP